MARSSNLVRTLVRALVASPPVRWARRWAGAGRRGAGRSSARDTGFWRTFADRFHLGFRLDDRGHPWLDGSIEGLPFEVHAGRRSHGETRMQMSASAALSVSVVPALRRPSQRRRTGDDRFDALCHVVGPEDEVCAAFDANAREKVAALISAGGSVHRGCASLEVPRGLDEDGARACANLVFHAAFALHHAPRTRIARLLRVATEDPIPAVRARALGAATSAAPDEPEVRRLLDRAARAPTDPWNDCLGRLHRGDVDGVCALVHDTDAPSLVALAVELAPAPARGALLDAAATSSAPGLTLAVLEGALLAAPGERLVLLERVSGGDWDTALDADGLAALVELVRACGDQPGERLDRVMPRLLRAPGREVADAALHALFADGSVRAVPALRAAGTKAPRAMAERIRSVIAVIQAKAGPVDAGRLTLVVEDGRGRLSVADDGGRMSLAGDDDPA